MRLPDTTLLSQCLAFSAQQNYDCPRLMRGILNQVVRHRFNPGAVVKAKSGLVSYDAPFRCWPIDMDAFMHMNNAMYVRVAELSRWSVFARSGTLNLLAGRGLLFLVVDNHATYFKPIGPFARYYVSTAVSFSDNKWIHYKHTFQSQPSDSAQEPVVYAVVDCRAVLKEKSGKTVRTDELVDGSEFYRAMAENNDKVKTWTAI